MRLLPSVLPVSLVISVVDKCLFIEAEDQVGHFSPIQVICLILVCSLGPGGYLRS